MKFIYNVNCKIIISWLFDQIRETDLNGDGQKDTLKFEAHFYADKPVKSLRLLLFFNFELKVSSRIRATDSFPPPNNTCISRSTWSRRL